VNRLGLEHEQLALGGALLGGVELEPGRAALDDGDRPGGMRVRPVGVLDEPGVQGLDSL
jgi:hypothetical protein